MAQPKVDPTQIDVANIDIADLSGTVTVGQVASIDVSDLSGTVTVGQVASIDVSDLSGTITLSQLGSLGVDLGEYLLANLPDPTTYPNCWALVTDAGGSPVVRTVVRSDGTDWRVIATEGAIVS
jgi:hypothetical protein